MQGSKVQLILAVCLAAGAGLRTSAQTLLLRADIPFEFNIGNTRMPAGVWTIESTTMALVLQVQSAESGRAFYLSGTPQTTPGESGESWFSFRQYGDQYFLAGARNGWNGTEFGFGSSRVEKESALVAKSRGTRIVLARR